MGSADRLIDWHRGIGNARYRAGTTGDPYQHEEHIKVVERRRARQTDSVIAERVRIPREAIELTRKSAAVGADVLLVTPYYNRPSRRSYHTTDRCGGTPVLYNSGQTAVSHEGRDGSSFDRNITASKRCGDVERVTDSRMHPPGFVILSGEDARRSR
jgi:dihydrodipicolinate synthase/N-acetylneuraminate lyase